MSHRRKRKVNVVKNSPFPVPIQSLTGVSAKTNYWYYYTAELKGDYATVIHSGDIKYLYTMGFFGKGMLSRGQPDVQKSLPNIHVPAENGDTHVIKVMRRRKYLRHKQWSGLKSEREEQDPHDLQEFDSDVEYCPQQEPPDFPGQHALDELNAVNANIDNSNTHQLDDGDEKDYNPHHIDNRVIKESDPAWSDTEADEDFWGESEQSKREVKHTPNVDSWDKMEVDHDFWGTDVKDGGNSGTNVKIQGTLSVDKTESETCDKSEVNAVSTDKVETETETATCDSSEVNSALNDTDRTEVNQDVNYTPIEKRKLDSTGNRNNEYTSQIESNIVVNKSCDHSSIKKLKLDKDLQIKQTSKNNTGHSQDFSSNHSIIEHSEYMANGSDSKNVVDEIENTQSSMKLQCDTQNLKISQASTDMSADYKDTDISSVECNKVLNAYEIHRHLETFCTHPTICQDKMDKAEQHDLNPQNVINCDSQENLVEPERGTKEVINNTIINEPKIDIAESERGANDVINDTVDIDRPPLHTLCIDEESDGEFLVIDDSDCDDTVTNIPIIKKTIWEPVRKKDSYSYNEPLVLSLEETFFLSYGLGCLTVKDEYQHVLSVCNMWQTFCQRRRRFLPCYVAYHFFRSKGWVPKSGITFGVDLILYREGPPFYHGSYSVIIKTVYEGDFLPVEAYKGRQLSWTSLACLNRVTEHVAKTLMFCYVIMPKDLTPEDLETPKCLNKFKIRLQLVNRWVSAQERGDKAKATEIP